MSLVFKAISFVLFLSYVGTSELKDPLVDVRDQILEKIDYPEELLKTVKGRKIANPPFGLKEEFCDYYLSEVKPRVKEFWKYIPASSRVQVDLDQDGSKEWVIMSLGLNETSWGAKNFVTILSKNFKTDLWEVSWFKLLGRLEFKDIFTPKLRIVDLDLNGHDEVVLNLFSLGASSSSYKSIIISEKDMGMKHEHVYSLESYKKPIMFSKEKLGWTLSRAKIIDYTDDEIAILYKGNKKPLNYRDEFKVVEEVSYWQ